LIWLVLSKPHTLTIGMQYDPADLKYPNEVQMLRKCLQTIA